MLDGDDNDSDSDFSDTILTPSTPRPVIDRSLSQLFEPEHPKPSLAVKGSTILDRPSNKLPNASTIMDRLTRARAMKSKIPSNITTRVPPATNPNTPLPFAAAEDAENSLIKTLRQDQNLEWSEIADQVNAQRLAKNEPATFTPNTAYSRYVRSAQVLPKPLAEIGFDAKDYVHLRHPHLTASDNMANTSNNKAGKKRIKDYNNATELKGNMRQFVGADVVRGELASAETTEMLVQAVAKVERNFWKVVADEMERAGTRFYEAEELARRYHEI
ncbi:hypothetical protein DDE82_005198 [Stemphylium lycopersici]|nr:hypothetical protein TW65_03288 [Stemphylium lycopersici]RAR03357.1 hypothetical protein DDE82_005198 [Stemphylium lycopersici]